MMLLIIPDALTFYLLMPMPGSQNINGLETAYYLDKILWLTRTIGFFLIIPFLQKTFSAKSITAKFTYGGFLIVALTFVYLVGFHFRADRIFYEPSVKTFLSKDQNRFPVDRMVLGVEINGKAKAYPLIVVGYHHKIQDTVGGKPVLVTYCTMCRSGEVYDPGVNENLPWRLVGMGKWNAIIEDAKTKSWWYQADGVAGAGPEKGTILPVIYSEQVTLKSWLERHPNSLILQPDPKYQSRYDKLKNYDINFQTSANEINDGGKLTDNSWVINISDDGIDKYFSWHELQKSRVINEVIGKKPILLAIENDNESFHSWNRTINGEPLTFTISDRQLTDTKTNSLWDWNGKCVSGSFKSYQLLTVSSQQVYWHTWQTFFNKTIKY